MKIFRFEKNETTRLETIRDGYLYLSQPEQFNDLEDCNIQGIFTPDYSEEYKKKMQECLDIMYSDAHHYFPLPNKTLESLRNFFYRSTVSDKDQKRQFKDAIFSAGVVGELRKYLKERTGVCCFFQGAVTESLMWAHYADSHKGFCVEYEVSNQDNLEIPLYPVAYTNNLPIPSINELLFCPNETLTRIITSKSIQWSHEKEYRLIYLNEIKDNENGKRIPIPQGIKPVRIIKGAKFTQPADAREKIFDAIDMEKVNYKDYRTKERF